MFQAQEDNVLPLTNPIHTASGELVDSIFVAKGSAVRITIAGMNKFETLWGEDAAKFNPDRWLEPSADGSGMSKTENLKGRAAEIQGYKHLLTFAYGPRMCLGRNFALTEVKVCLLLLRVLYPNIDFAPFLIDCFDGPYPQLLFRASEWANDEAGFPSWASSPTQSGGRGRSQSAFGCEEGGVGKNQCHHNITHGHFRESHLISIRRA
jgi:hypothetical protein